MAFAKFLVRTFSSSATVPTQNQVKDTLYRLVQLELRGHDSQVLTSYQQFVNLTAKELDITIGERLD